MIARFFLSLGTLLVAVAVTIAVALISPAQRPPVSSVSLPRPAKLTCAAPGKVLVGGETKVTVAPLKGGSDTLNSPGQIGSKEAVSLLADQPITGGALVNTPLRAYAPCGTSVTSGIVMVGDPGSSELLLANSDGSEAAVDLSLLGPDGEITEVGARGIAIAPGTTRRIALSVLAPKGPVGVVFQASRGRVAVLASALQGRPPRFAAPTRVDTKHLITAVPAGADAKILLSNPRESRAEVSVEALGPESTYTPATAAKISVPPMSSITVNLGDALSKEASSLRIRAPEPIGAAVTAASGNTAPATAVAGAAGTELAAVAPGGGAVLLANPGGRRAHAEVTAQPLGGKATTVKTVVEPGRTVSVPVPAGEAVNVAVSSGEHLTGSVTSAGAGGTVVVPLGLSAKAPVRAIPAELSPGLR